MNGAKSVKQKIVDAVKSNEFKEAKRLKDSFPEVDLGWLARKIEICANNHDEIVGYTSEKQSLARLATVGLACEGEKVVMQPVYDGKINIGCAIYRKNSGDVFEKVHFRKSSWKREKSVFGFFDSSEIASPKYLGSYSNGVCFSVYHEALHPREAAFPLEKVHSRINLALKLWKAKLMPSEEALAVANERKYSQRLKDTSLMNELMARFVSKHGRGRGSSTVPLATQLQSLVELSKSPNQVMFHSDLCADNILLCGSDSYLIDWDKWGFTQIGSGVDFHYKVVKDLRILEQINEQIPETEGGVNVAALNFVLFNVLGSIKRKRKKCTEGYLNELSDLMGHMS